MQTTTETHAKGGDNQTNGASPRMTDHTARMTDHTRMTDHAPKAAKVQVHPSIPKWAYDTAVAVTEVTQERVNDVIASFILAGIKALHPEAVPKVNHAIAQEG